LTDQPDHTGRPLWARGDMMFRVAGSGTEADRLVKIDRPFATVGRARTADIPVNDRGASGNHAYLHLDPRGVYVVDLVTRTGTRINGNDLAVGWLRPGDRIEVAGRRIELLRIRIDGEVVSPPPCTSDLLAEADRPDLPAVSLEPLQGSDAPWVVSSELIFLGWSGSCGIQIRDESVARTHCALVRSPGGVSLVDLGDNQTWVEDQPVRGVAALRDGDLITLGSTQFTVRIGPAAAGRGGASASLPAAPHQNHPLALYAPPVELLPALSQIETGQLPAETRDNILAWMVGAIQGGQRQQGEFQIAVTETLRQIQQDSASLLSAHLSRIEKIDREIAGLRAELERRQALPAPPSVTPLRVPRPAPGAEPTSVSGASTTWLLDRVGQLENENKSAWKDLLGRISTPKSSP